MTFREHLAYWLTCLCFVSCIILLVGVLVGISHTTLANTPKPVGRIPELNNQTKTQNGKR